jgi:hypothetical protein
LTTCSKPVSKLSGGPGSAENSQFLSNHGDVAVVERDHLGREYVKLGFATDIYFLEPAVADFFDIYDHYKSPEARTESEMRELYETLATSDAGEDVYLSDGVWLKREGTLTDCGR